MKNLVLLTVFITINDDSAAAYFLGPPCFSAHLHSTRVPRFRPVWQETEFAVRCSSKPATFIRLNTGYPRGMYPYLNSVSDTRHIGYMLI